MKYLQILILSIFQSVFILLSFFLYRKYIGWEQSGISIGISFYYYQLILPFIIAVWNIICAKVANKKSLLSMFFLLISAIILYWSGSFNSYPIKSLFAIVTSIFVLVIGSFYIRKTMK